MRLRTAMVRRKKKPEEASRKEEREPIGNHGKLGEKSRKHPEREKAFNWKTPAPVA